MPAAAQSCLRSLADQNSSKLPSLIKYFVDMDTAFAQLSNTLAEDGQMAMIVGTEQIFSANGKRHPLPLALATEQLARRHSLHVDRVWEVDLTKNNDGDIKQESILFMSKSVTPARSDRGSIPTSSLVSSR